MSCAGRWLAALSTVLGTASVPAAEAPANPLGTELVRTTARLADVMFVDPQHGWAVGDRGTVWHTDDGGQRWLLEPSGVTCPLYSVWFVSPQVGFAAGGFSDPFLHTGSGVLLSTRDGGLHWQNNPKLLLPILKQVRFFDDRYGWAAGSPSSMYPSGVLTTRSHGLEWLPLPGDTSGWLTGAFLDPQTGLLAGRSGTLGQVRYGGLASVSLAEAGLRSLTRVELVPPTFGWLIGDGGLVRMTADRGTTWQPAPGRLPPEVLDQFDLAAMAVRGPRCWIAGAPGTLVFHTPDAGRTWMAFSTGQSLPLAALWMADDQHGWAVGALGTILGTSDGGRTWQRQHAGGARLALLGLFSRPDDVPWELLARLCGSEGYLGVVEVLNRQDVESRPRDWVALADRLHEAAVNCGADGARLDWRFPVRQPGLGLNAEKTVNVWNATNGGRGLAQLETQLVKQIRLWRPEVILTAEPGAGADAAVVRLVADAVARAVRQAAEPGSAPEQLSLAGLQTWQVKKVYAALPPGERGGLELPTAQFAPRLGCSLADAAAAPRGLLSDRFHRCEPMLGFRLLSSQASQESERADFFTGLNLPPGGEARRELGEAASEGVESLGRMAQRRRTFQAIVAQSEKNPQRGLQLLAEAGRFAEQLDDDGGAWLLEQLAEQYFETGQWELAAETRQALAERYPRHPLSRAALRWLVEYYASGEAAWRARSTQPGHLMNSSQPGGEAAQPGDRPGCAIALATRAERTQPALFADPALRFALAAAYRRQGNARQAERFYAAASRGVNHGAWRACAEGEQWLAAPRGNSPKPVLRCPAATGKPRLDGRLDDAVWRAVQPVALTSAYRDDTEWPARVMLAYDAEFLYLAITARQAPGVRYEAATGPRPRHADLSAHDRVELFLDVDRDFVSYYHFTIDDRGWAAEDCWGDRTWNPQWFVAARTENQTWTVEAAIPWNQLTGKPPQAHDAWAIGIQRIVPGVGFQSWNVPAAVEVIPEGFGYLSFQ